MSALKTLVIVIAGVAAGISLWNWLLDDPQVAPQRAKVVNEYVVAPRLRFQNRRSGRR